MQNDVSSGPLRPRQAVILAGGQGTRLRPFSDIRPKPMIEIQGRPFLEHIVEMLRDQGFEEIVMLLGYLPEVVRDHFGDGSRWGLRIRYSVTDVENNTGRRVKLAEPLLDEHFFLLYCDNYWPMHAERMWQRFLAAGAPAMLTVYTNKDGWTKNSIRVDAEGFITAFDKRGQTPDVQGVEISYGIFDRTVLALLPEHDNVSFEDTVFPTLIARRQLAAYVTGHRYYSVGSVARLPQTEVFLARTPTIILDRDGVINRKPPRACYVRSWAEWEWVPGSLEALALLRAAGYRVILVSNQAGIARGAMTESDLHEIHREMSRQITRAGGHVEAIYFCPHDWDEGCECRKPKPGMLLQAQRDFNLDLTRTYFVGDDERDAQAAEAAGCLCSLVDDEHPLLAFVQSFLRQPQPVGIERPRSSELAAQHT